MANVARGEVALKIEGRTFTLCNELERLGRLTHATGITSMSELIARVRACDPHVLSTGTRLLCVSDNADELPALLRMPHFLEVQKALLAAITAGWPDPKEDAAKGETTAAT